jgi:DNA-binding transcriptional LysR family regulator
VDLRQLRYFVAVVEERGFRRASRELYVAQPALSRALRQLELSLGVRLLERTAQGVELTDAGGEFLVHARLIIAHADAATAAMRDRVGCRPALRIGVVAGMLGAGELTAPIVDDFRHERPNLDVELEELSFVDQVGPLLGGALDVALVRDPLDHPGLDVVPLASEERALLVGAAHPLAGEAGVSATDVLDEPTLPLGSPDAWSAFWQLDDLRGKPNRFAQTAPATTVPSMQLAVASGQMVISVPGAMGRLAPNPLVRCVDLHDAEPSTIAVARRRHDRRTEVAAFVDQAIATTEKRIDLLPGGAVLR